MNPSMGRVLINGIPYSKPVIKVASIKIDGGAACIVPVAELMAVIEGGGEYTVEIKDMAVSQFDKLPEFTGW